MRSDEDTMYVLEAMALVHDIDQSCMEKMIVGWKDLEAEGPAAARDAYCTGLSGEVIRRVEYLGHHTYKDIDGLDYQDSCGSWIG